MLDKELRRIKHQALQKNFPRKLDYFHPIVFSTVGLMFGLVAIAGIVLEMQTLAAISFLLNRFFDVIDGGIAKTSGNETEVGSFLDIFYDFIVYVGAILAFGYAYPDLMFLSLMLMGTYVINLLLWTYPQIVIPHPIHSSNQHYPRGLVEGTETALFYFLFILYPQPFLFQVFIGLMVLTIVIRFFQAIHSLTRNS